MAHKTSGVILVELPTTRGTTRNGKDWEKREYILESSDRYHTKMRMKAICRSLYSKRMKYKIHFKDINHNE